MSELIAFITSSTGTASSRVLERLSGQPGAPEPDAASRATLRGLQELLLDTLGQDGGLAELDKHPDLDADSVVGYGVREATRYGLSGTPAGIFLEVVRLYRQELFSLMEAHSRDREFRHAVGRFLDRVLMGFWYGWEGSWSSADPPGPETERCAHICHSLPYPAVMLDSEGSLIAATAAVRDLVRSICGLEGAVSDEDVLSWLEPDLGGFLNGGADEAAVIRDSGPSLCRVRFRKVRDLDGRPAGAIVTLHMWTEGERPSRISRGEDAPPVTGIQGLFTWSACATTCRLQSIGESVESVRGYRDEAFLEDENLWLDSIHPDDRELVLEALSRTREEGRAEVEYRVVLPSGDARWVRERMVLSSNACGTPTINGLTVDVDQARKAQHQNLLLESAVTGSSEPLAVLDVEGRAIHVSEGLLGVLGFARDDLEQQGGLVMVHADQEVFRAALETVATGEEWSGQTRLRAAGGGTKAVTMTARPIKDRAGHVAGVLLSYAGDVPGRSTQPIPEPPLPAETVPDPEPRSEPASHASILQELVDACPDMIFQMRVLPELSFEYVSPSSISVVGYTPDDHYADPELWFKAVHADSRQDLVAVFDPEYDFDQILQLRWVGPDNQIFVTEQRMRPLFDEATGALSGIEGVVRRIRGASTAGRPAEPFPVATEGEPCSRELDLGTEIEAHLAGLRRAIYLSERGIRPRAISLTTGMAPALVDEYVALAQRLRCMPTPTDREDGAGDTEVPGSPDDAGV